MCFRESIYELGALINFRQSPVESYIGCSIAIILVLLLLSSSIFFSLNVEHIGASWESFEILIHTGTVVKADTCKAWDCSACILS